MGYCIKCGERLDDDAAFCTECGMKVQSKEEVKENILSDISEKAVVKKMKDKSNNIMFPLIFCSISIVLIIAACIYLSSGYTCDWCGEDYFGTSYYDCFEPELTYCENCAKEYYSFGGYQNYKN